MTDEDRFAERLGELMRQSDPVPAVPREEMWARIDARRRFSRHAAARAARDSAPKRGSPEAVRPESQVPGHVSTRRWIAWGAAIAAALVLGIGIGRIYSPSRTAAPATVAASDDTGAAPASGVSTPYRLVMLQHLNRTEALLASLPAAGTEGSARDIANWGQDLLTSTRLLLDSPAAADPRTVALLQDLELVLAQIAALSGQDENGELRLIRDGIRQNDMMLRLRAVTSAAAD